MSEQELEKLDRLLASFLGMKLEENDLPNGPYYYHAELSGVLGYAQLVPDYSLDQWHPHEFIEQAMRVAEKAGYLTLTQGCKFWDARIESARGSGNAFAETPAEAICLAVQSWLTAAEGGEGYER